MQDKVTVTDITELVGSKYAVNMTASIHAVYSDDLLELYYKNHNIISFTWDMIYLDLGILIDTNRVRLGKLAYKPFMYEIVKAITLLSEAFNLGIEVRYDEYMLSCITYKDKRKHRVYSTPLRIGYPVKLNVPRPLKV